MLPRPFSALIDVLDRVWHFPKPDFVGLSPHAKGTGNPMSTTMLPIVAVEYFAIVRTTEWNLPNRRTHGSTGCTGAPGEPSLSPRSIILGHVTPAHNRHPGQGAGQMEYLSPADGVFDDRHRTDIDTLNKDAKHRRGASSSAVGRPHSQYCVDVGGVDRLRNFQLDPRNHRNRRRPRPPAAPRRVRPSPSRCYLPVPSSSRLC